MEVKYERSLGGYSLISLQSDEEALVVPSYIIEPNGNLQYIKRIEQYSIKGPNLKIIAFQPDSQVTISEEILMETREKLEILLLPKNIHFPKILGFKCYNIFKNIKEIRFALNCNLKDLPNDTFKDSNLMTIYIPSSVETIGSNCFQDCINLQNIIFFESSSLKTIQTSAFMNCDSLKYVDFPKSLEIISDYAFCNSGLEKLNFQKNNNLYLIGKDCLKLNDSLESVIMPPNIKTIGEGSFHSCKNLNYVSFDMESQLKSLPQYLFAYTSLVNIILPHRVEVIGENVFFNCDNLAQIIAPNCLRLIENLALYSKNLESFEIGENVSVFKFFSFHPNTKLVLNTNNKFYKMAENGVIYPFNMKQISFIPLSIKRITIPESVEKVEMAVFNQRNVKSIYFPSSVIEISNSSEEYHLDSIEKIDLSRCTRLQKIGLRSFSHTSIKKIVVPSSVIGLGKCFNGCRQLKRISFKNYSKITSLSSCIFKNCTNLEIISFPSSLEVIQSNAFKNCKNLKKVMFRNYSKLKIIEPDAFKNCKNIQSINLESCKYLGKIPFSAFDQELYDSNISFEKYQQIKEDTIIELDKEEKIAKISNKIKYIGDLAGFNMKFYEIYFQESSILHRIGRSAFFNNEIRSITFPSSLEEICEFAFMNNYKLNYVNFGPNSNLRSIRRFAFYGCWLNHFNFTPNLMIVEEFVFADHKMGLIDLSRSLVEIVNYKSFNCKKIKLSPNTRKLKKFEGKECHIIGSPNNFIVENEGMLYSNKKLERLTKDKESLLIRRGTEIIGKRFINLFQSEQTKLKTLFIPASVRIIAKNAFHSCKNLQKVRFHKNSQLYLIGEEAFYFCVKLKSIRFPKSLKIIERDAFGFCSLEKIVFPVDSQLESITKPFELMNIKSLELPKSIKHIESIYPHHNKISIDNEYFKTVNQTSVLSRDGTELYMDCFDSGYQFPSSVRVIKKNAIPGFRLYIPSHIEIIEDMSHPDMVPLTLDFSKATNLREIHDVNCNENQNVILPSSIEKIHFNAFNRLQRLVISNNNFHTSEEGVVTSQYPRAILFVPTSVQEIEIDPELEIIFSHAFRNSQIKKIELPKTLRIIGEHAFENSMIEILKLHPESNVVTYSPFKEMESLKEFWLCSTLTEEVNLFTYLYGPNIFVCPNFRYNGKFRYLCGDVGEVVLPKSSISEFLKFICSDLECKKLHIVDG